jgi:transposase-like protein
VKVSCYFINYKIFVNIVKYKLDLMRKRMEVEERDATSRSSFRCTTCNKQFSDLEADQLFDFASQVLYWVSVHRGGTNITKLLALSALSRNSAAVPFFVLKALRLQ